ncbi:hypothetical protein [Maribacter polysaccharolyticus]|uniref:hypothetical protein n=1 Tax=Maribacter polysaccharolyticus TaxID=3020831 RepID=UPI00237FBE29|nr:hypothetical protein [Maribacter polysaccharolyticus]MDE3740629.1 hypothetical protein [Maribacter polysaccharolyticus]
MSLKSENFGNDPHWSTQKASFNGLSGLINNLEKNFFSQISVRHDSPINGKINLIIEMDCNLNLIDMITQSYNGAWGTFNQIEYSLAEDLDTLDQCNDAVFDVDEFIINLKDTSIVIDKLYDQSIPDQLPSIFSNLEKHFLALTKRNIEVPYEIFVAVFEEELFTLAPVSTNTTHNYSTYWGLYFESEKDAVIYDLEKSTILRENLYMINK